MLVIPTCAYFQFLLGSTITSLNILVHFFPQQKALAPLFTYSKNGLNTESTFDVKVQKPANFASDLT